MGLRVKTQWLGRGKPLPYGVTPRSAPRIGLLFGLGDNPAGDAWGRAARSASRHGVNDNGGAAVAKDGVVVAA